MEVLDLNLSLVQHSLLEPVETIIKIIMAFLSHQTKISLVLFVKTKIIYLYVHTLVHDYCVQAANAHSHAGEFKLSLYTEGCECISHANCMFP